MALLGWMIIVPLLFSMLAGCTSPNTSEPVAASTSSAPQPSVTLVLWHSWSGSARETLSSLVDEFNRQHPNGRVLAQSVPAATMPADLRAAALAGSGPHLVLMPNTWIGGLAQEDVIVALDELISPAEQQALLPVTIGGAQLVDAEGQRHLYGLPVSFDTVALFYNRVNVEAPQNTATMLQIARGLSDPQATPPRWGLALNLSLDNTIGYLYAFNGNIFNEQGQLVLGGAGRAGTEQWLEWLARLQTDEQLFVQPDASLAVERALKNGMVFMAFGWAHELVEYRRLWGTDMGIAPLPTLSETNQAPRVYVQSDVLAINSRVGDVERRAAVEFLRFMSSPPAQAALLGNDIQPARQDVQLGGDEPQQVAARTFRTAAEHGQPMPNTPQRESVQQVLRIMQQQVLAGSASPADAITEADARLQALLTQPAP